MMNRLPGFLILVSLIAPLIAARGFACSCFGDSPTPQSFKATSDVFIATVVEIKRPPTEITYDKNGIPGVSGRIGPDVIRLSIEESFKGDQGPEVLTKQGSHGCAYDFKLGEKYLVYGRVENGNLDVDKCSRTNLISWATADLKYIRGLKSGETQATLYGNVERDTFSSEGKPILRTPAEELTVIVESKEIREETTATAGGEFELTLPPGEYKIWVTRNTETISRPVEPIALKKDDCLRTRLIVKFD